MKRIILAAAIAAVASMSVAAFASATPASTSHFQMGSSTLTATTTVPGGATYFHSWAITTNPCTGQFYGTTDSTPGQDAVDTGDVVFGNILGPIINIGGVQKSGYSWTYVGMMNGLGLQHDSLGQYWTDKFTNTVVTQGVCA